MEKTDPLYSVYQNLLYAELQPAFGCTEPAAVAYAAALAFETLTQIPDFVNIACSGNIINVY